MLMFLEEEEGVGKRTSSVGRRSAKVIIAAEGSAWPCKGWRCRKVNPGAVVILVFKLGYFCLCVCVGGRPTFWESTFSMRYAAIKTFQV